MRITDEGGDEKDNFRGGAKPSIMDSIKAKSQVKITEESESSTPPWERAKPKDDFDLEAPKVTADVQSAKLKQLLGQIKQS
jgi:hypothetical protein